MNRLTLPALILLAATAQPTAQAAAQPAAQTSWGLPQLMQSLATVKSASASFSERETLAALTAPLTETGTLTYIAPDQMQKLTTAPVPERFTLDAGQVTLTGPDRQIHHFALNQDPRIAGLTAGILATLAGDQPTLSRLYKIELSGAPANWQLVLLPADPKLAQIIAWIRIAGTASHITAIDTQNTDGDHTEMTIAEHAN